MDMEHGGKKQKRQEEEVKQESSQYEQVGGPSDRGGSGSPVAKFVIAFDQTLLDCPLCRLPLKPPVFQCKATHAACAGCAASLSNECASCGDVYEHIPQLDPYVMAAEVQCPNAEYGCRSWVSYCLLGDHQLVCAHAPCYCPEPGCYFRGSPLALGEHLARHHDWLVTSIPYGERITVNMEHTERRHLLVSGDREDVFLLVASEPGAGGRHVKVVHVRASAEQGPSWYKCKVWTTAPADEQDAVLAEGRMKSYSEANTEVGGSSLLVPSYYMATAAGDLFVRVRIFKKPKL